MHKDRYEYYFHFEQHPGITYTPDFGKMMSRDRFLAIWSALLSVDESVPPP